MKRNKEIKKKIEAKEEIVDIHKKESIEKLKKDPNIKRKKKKLILISLSLAVSLIIGALTYFFSRNLTSSGVTALIIFILFIIYVSFQSKLEASKRIAKMETVFPDFIELMASNLRAGMTIDKALLLSSRKEFSPLDEEINLLGKDIVTGKDINRALLEMSIRIKSQKIKKTIEVIITGIKSGGNLAILLEQTAVNMRERSFVEKRAASSVLMYIIFIFFAVGVGAPALFSLSAILIRVLSNILGDVPTVEASISIPITFSSVSVSISFITYFSLIFITAIVILASLLLGLVQKGEEKQGVKYILPLLAVSMTVYFTIRFLLQNFFTNLSG